jgi:ribosome-associated protein
MELKSTARMESHNDADVLDIEAGDAQNQAAPARPTRGAAGRISSRELAVELARLASDDKCTDVVLLDVRGLSPISDYVIVASGTSDRQMRAVADHAEDLGAQHGHTAFRSSKDPRALWLLIDFSDVVIHIFEPNTRAHYDIEMMWGDARRIEWDRSGKAPAAKSRRGAGAGVN